MILILSRLISALPMSAALFVGRLMGWLWYWLIPIRRGVARRNLQRVYGDKLTARQRRRLLRRCFELQAMSAIDMLRAPAYTREMSELYVARRGFEHVEAGLARGKGVIVACAHIGNVDMIGISQALRGLSASVIAKEIHWAPAQSFIRAVRQNTGVGLIAPKRSKETIINNLADNGIVGMAVDQHMAPHRALVCSFFGQLASTSPAPARFAYETDATMVTAVIRRRGNRGHFELEIEPFKLENPSSQREENIRHNTERINRIIEGWIEQEPEQWLWLHRRWKVQDAPHSWEIPEHLQHLLS